MTPPRVSSLDDGRIARVELADPPRNVLDGATLDALTAALRGLGQHGPMRALLLTAEGPNFSFGASVPEHAPEQAPLMLTRFHEAIRAALDVSLPTVAVLRGQCLGGGLELALTATRIVAAPGARLGQPEIRLAALAPVASLLLPHRLGQARAEALLLSGRVITAAEALTLGLVDEVADDPEAAALAWLREHILGHSAAALRLATRAARWALRRELDVLLPELELLYRDQLLATRDAAEGVRAFVERRAPTWSDR